MKENKVYLYRVQALCFSNIRNAFGLITYHELICCQERHTHNKDSAYLLLLLLFHFLLYCSSEGFYLFRDTEKILHEAKGGLQANMVISDMAKY